MIEDKKTGLLIAENDEEKTWWNVAEGAKHEIKMLKIRNVKAEKDAILENLNILISSGTLDREENRRAEAMRSQQQAAKAQIAAQEKEQLAIWNTALAAVQAGADASSAETIQNASSKEEALVLSASFLGSQFRADIEAKQFTRDLQQASFNLSVNKFSVVLFYVTGSGVFQ